jgi:hypothetical protein
MPDLEWQWYEMVDRWAYRQTPHGHASLIVWKDRVRDILERNAVQDARHILGALGTLPPPLQHLIDKEAERV